MADLASLGLAVDSSQLVAADKALGDFAASGKNAQLSADVLVASAVRLGISVEEVERRLAAANDNLEATSEQAMKLADATKQLSAANDNFSTSMGNAGAAAVDAGRGFFGTIEHVLNLTGHLKLLALGAYALFPAFRGIVNAGLSTALLQIIPAAGLAAQAFSGLISVLSPALAFLSSIAVPILIAVSAFELLSAIWTKGSDLLDKYANSLRALYSPDVIQNLQKLTSGQQDIISAEQVARATELGVRLQDAGFIIKNFLNTSIFDFTNLSLKVQSIWVGFVEIVAKIVQWVQQIPWDKIGTAATTVAKAIPGVGPVVTGVAAVTDLLPSAPKADNTKSIENATSRLSAMMGVAALATEALNKTTKSAGDLDKEFNIGDTFIARYSDDIKKLADGIQSDSWDRVAASIDKTTARLEANAASVGKTTGFQESLRVETQLLNSTAGGLNAVTDKQTDLYVELRTQGVDPLNASIQAGIRFDEARAASFVKLSKAAGDAKMEFDKANFEITNQLALDQNANSVKALTAYSAAQKGAIAADQVRLQLRADVTKGIATQEQVEERAAAASKLASETQLKALSEAARARALAATQTTATTQVSIDAAGKDVAAAYKLTAVEQARQQLETDASARHTTINQKELADLTAQINKTGDLKQQEAAAAEARKVQFDQQTLFMSDIDKQIAAVQQKLHGDDWQKWMNDGLSASMRLNDALKNIKDTGLQFTQSFVQGLLQGKSGMQALTDAATQLASKLADKALMDLFSGNFLQAGIEGIIAAGAAIFAGDQKQKKALQDAKDAWAGMTDQIDAFNQAAKGFTLGPLSQELSSLTATLRTLQTAALKAGDQNGFVAVNTQFIGAVNRIVGEFNTGTQVLTPFAQAMQNLNNEAQGLKDELNNLGFGSIANTIDASVQAQIKALTIQYTQALTDGLTQRLNTAQGNTYLNDAATLLTQHTQDLANAAELGNNPGVLSQISAVFQAEAQKIVEDAGLVGSSFNDFIKLFPDFAGVVTQSATALQAANDKFAALAKTINDYLKSLQTSSSSILSPQDQLAAAQKNFDAQLALATAGDQTAMSSITQTAQTLLDQAKNFYASSAGYADVYNQVTGSLGKLATPPGMAAGGIVGNGTYNVDSVLARYAGGGDISLAGGEHITRASSVTASTLPALQYINQTGRSPSNDNGAALNALGQQLVRAIVGCASGETGAINQQTEVFRSLMTKLIKSVDDSKPKAARPAAKAIAS